MLDIRKLLDALASEVMEEVKNRMTSPIGYNPRLRENTLANGEIYNSVSAYTKDENTIIFQIADYWEYIVRGWKKTGRYPRYIQ